jgi:CRISPR-associated protein Csx17
LAVSQNNSSSQLLAVLTALGATERALSQNFSWTTETIYLRPLHGLKRRWLDEADNGFPEFRLAQSIASTSAWLGDKTLWFRQHLEAIEWNNKQHCWGWNKNASNDVTWHDGNLIDSLNAMLARRVMRVAQSGAKDWRDWSPRPACLNDVTDFIEGRTNDALLADLIWGLSLLDWHQVKPLSPEFRDAPEAIPSSFYALLRLCFRRADGNNEAVPLVPAILHRAMSGDGKAASELAAQRLRASGQAPLVDELPVADNIAKRTAAAMLFPISRDDFRQLEKMIIKPPKT